MRIDIIKPLPTPEVAKVSSHNDTSRLENEDNRQLRKKEAEYQQYSQNAKLGKDKALPGEENFKQKLPVSNNIQYKINKDPNIIITEIVDSNSQEVVEQIPSEKIVEMINTLNKVFGSSVDKKG